MQDAQQFIEYAAEIGRAFGEFANPLEQHGAVTSGQGINKPENIITRDGAEHRLHLLLAHFAAAKGNCLVEEAQGVAHAAVRRCRQRQQGRVVVVDLLGFEDVAQLPGDLFERHALETELQAARQHRHGHFLRIGRREQEFHMLRWFFKCFQ